VSTIGLNVNACIIVQLPATTRLTVCIKNTTLSNYEDQPYEPAKATLKT